MEAAILSLTTQIFNLLTAQQSHNNTGAIEAVQNRAHKTTLNGVPITINTALTLGISSHRVRLSQKTSKR